MDPEVLWWIGVDSLSTVCLRETKMECGGRALVALGTFFFEIQAL